MPSVSKEVVSSVVVEVVSSVVNEVVPSVVVEVVTSVVKEVVPLHHPCLLDSCRTQPQNLIPTRCDISAVRQRVFCTHQISLL